MTKTANIPLHFHPFFSPRDLLPNDFTFVFNKKLKTSTVTLPTHTVCLKQFTNRMNHATFLGLCRRVLQ